MPKECKAAIVTCGGLCPRLNSVIREVVTRGLSNNKSNNDNDTNELVVVASSPRAAAARSSKLLSNGILPHPKASYNNNKNAAATETTKMRQQQKQQQYTSPTTLRRIPLPSVPRMVLPAIAASRIHLQNDRWHNQSSSGSVWYRHPPPGLDSCGHAWIRDSPNGIGIKLQTIAGNRTRKL